jgi:ABC-type antimicrobial peptide transport system permease subunit
LTFTLIISSISTIQSYQEYDEELAYYELGSDILIRGVNVANDNLKNQINAIEGVQGATYLKATSQRVSFEGVLYSYVVLGINATEFAEIGYFEKEYLDGRSPSAFFSQLEDSNDCIMQKDQLAKLGGATNGTVSIWGEKYSVGLVKFNLDLQGEFNFLPRFYMEAPSEDNTVYRFSIVGNYDLVSALAYSGSMSIAGDLLVKVQSGKSVSEIASIIESELGRNVEDVDELMGTNQGSLRNTMLFGSLNSSFISSLVITIAAISLMIIIQAVENEKEVVMLKTLGMSPRQLFLMFLTEALTVVIFGSIIGLGTGIFSANMLMEMLTFETVIPQTEIVYPPLQMLLAFGILFLTAFLAAAFTSWLVFRKDTIKAIKQI